MQIKLDFEVFLNCYSHCIITSLMLHLIFVIGGNNYTFACLVWSSKSSNLSGELAFNLMNLLN